MKRILIYILNLVLLVFVIVFSVSCGINLNIEPSGQEKTSITGEKTTDDGETSTVIDDVFYTIVFKDYDGTVLQTSSIKQGLMPVYEKPNPTREKDEEHSYKFRGWTPALDTVVADTIYTAIYDVNPLFTIPEKDNAAFETSFSEISEYISPTSVYDAITNNYKSVTINAGLITRCPLNETIIYELNYSRTIDFETGAIYCTETLKEKIENEFVTRAKLMSYLTNDQTIFEFTLNEFPCYSESENKQYLGKASGTIKGYLNQGGSQCLNDDGKYNYCEAFKCAIADRRFIDPNDFAANYYSNEDKSYIYCSRSDNLAAYVLRNRILEEYYLPLYDDGYLAYTITYHKTLQLENKQIELNDYNEFDFNDSSNYYPGEMPFCSAITFSLNSLVGSRGFKPDQFILDNYILSN